MKPKYSIYFGYCFCFIWVTVATMGLFGGVVRLFLMYELKAHLIISKYTKEQQQTLARNVSLKNKTKNPEFFPQWTYYELGRSDKISDPLLNYMGKTKQNNNNKKN